MKEPYLKISAHFHLHDLPESHHGLIGEQINFNGKGMCSFSDLATSIIRCICEYYERGNLLSLDRLLEELENTSKILLQVVDDIRQKMRLEKNNGR